MPAGTMHTVILLGVTKVLSTRGEFSGTVKMFFQPAEKRPGRTAHDSGGWLETLKRKLSGFSRPSLPVIRFIIATVLCPQRLVEITVKEKGSCGIPEEGIDSIVVAAKSS